MLATAIVAAGVAGISALVAIGSLVVATRSANEARRSADAAEKAAEAANRSAIADMGADHRARTPRITVKIESKAGYQQGQTDALYEVVNDGPEDLESVVVCRPQTDDSVHYNVAATGRSDYGDEAEVGPLPLAARTRFTLAVGPWNPNERLPVFRIRIVCTSTTGESWELPFTLDPPT